MRDYRLLSIIPILAVAPFAQMPGCKPTNEFQPPDPPKVTVAKPLQQTVSDYLIETGTTEAVEIVELRARVSGILEKVGFVPGQLILEPDEDPNVDPQRINETGEAAPILRVGDQLFQIEKDQYQAKLDASKAALEAANVRVNRGETEYQRQLELQTRNATTDFDVVLAKANLDSAKAEVLAAQAEIDSAQINLDFCDVIAPISGRIGDRLVKEGNLVGEMEKTHLTTIIKYKPIYANFNISERAFLRLRDMERSGERAEVNLRLANETDYPHQGRFDFADLAIDQSTGTFKLRAIFDNEDYQIVPGLFVEVKVPLNKIENALLLPESAILSDLAGRYVLTVDADNKVARKNVVIGSKQGNMLVIESGIEADDNVIIEGLLRARPEAPVTPETTTLPALNSAQDEAADTSSDSDAEAQE